MRHRHSLSRDDLPQNGVFIRWPSAESEACRSEPDPERIEASFRTSGVEGAINGVDKFRLAVGSRNVIAGSCATHAKNAAKFICDDRRCAGLSPIDSKIVSGMHCYSM